MEIDYNKILLRTLGEFFTDLDLVVENQSFTICKNAYQLVGSHILHVVKESVDEIFIAEKTLELFKNEEEAFFDNENEFFSKIDIKTWFPLLDSKAKKIVWRYLKSIKFLCGNI